MPKKPWSQLTHHVYRAFEKHGLMSVPVGVAVSGGRDSMLLLEIISEIAPARGLQVHVLHAHHGDSADEAQQSFRDSAYRLVEERAQKLHLKFHGVKSQTPLLSEDDFREFRRREFQRLKTELSLQLVFLGHHAQDLLETRIMRLIRGTGGQGLEAMRDDERPFLPCSAEELDLEARSRELSFLEDPSNMDSRYFRNWLRHEWLPQLEAKSPGALKSFARSLDTWIESERLRDEQFPPPGLFLSSTVISVDAYLRLSVSEQRRALAYLLHELKSSNYSRSHIEEIQKRLDKIQNEYTFNVAGLAFTVTTSEICVSLNEKVHLERT